MPDAKTKLLVVDDDPSVRMSFGVLLAEAGYQVRMAEDGFSALVEIRRQIPDVLLSDLNMPGMSGFELLPVVRRLFPAIRTIAMSGTFGGDAASHSAIADAFHRKGGSVGLLLETVRDLLSRERRAFTDETLPGEGGAQREEQVCVNCRGLPDFSGAKSGRERSMQRRSEPERCLDERTVDVSH